MNEPDEDGPRPSSPDDTLLSSSDSDSDNESTLSTPTKDAGTLGQQPSAGAKQISATVIPSVAVRRKGSARGGKAGKVVTFVGARGGGGKAEERYGELGRGAAQRKEDAVSRASAEAVAAAGRDVPGQWGGMTATDLGYTMDGMTPHERAKEKAAHRCVRIIYVRMVSVTHAAWH